MAEKFRYTVVYLTSGRTAFVGGTETERCDDEFTVYSSKEGADPTRFNWLHVECYRTVEMDLPEDPDEAAAATTEGVSTFPYTTITDAEIEKFLGGAS